MLKMSEKIFFIFTLFVLPFCLMQDVRSEVIAPALQYMREDYPAAFLSSDDYSIKLNTKRRYKLRCSGGITGVAVGDGENLKVFQEDNEEDDDKMLFEIAQGSDIVVKTKYETYTYMQIFTSGDKPVTVILSINPKNEVENLIKFGPCTMYEDIN